MVVQLKGIGANEPNGTRRHLPSGRHGSRKPRNPLVGMCISKELTEPGPPVYGTARRRARPLRDPFTDKWLAATDGRRDSH